MVVEMGLGAPAPTVADTTLRDEAVDMRVPLKVTPEGVEDTDKAGSKTFGFVVFVEHTEDNIADGGEKATKEGTVSEEEGPEFFSDSEDTVAVPHIQNLKSHGGSTVNGVFCTAGGAETAVAAERDKFKFPAFVTGIHGPTERRVTAVKHPVNIPDDGLAWMEDIKHFFIMVSKNFLEYVHKTIMQDMSAESNPTPHE